MPKRCKGPDGRPSKKEVFTAFFQEKGVYLHLDPRHKAVVVPQIYGAQPHLVLEYGPVMPIMIPDLEITDDGVTATLSFNRLPFWTFVPWEAVYAVAATDGNGVVYEEDVPREVNTVKPPREPLRSVPPVGDPEPTAPRAPPALRLVKS